MICSRVRGEESSARKKIPEGLGGHEYDEVNIPISKRVGGQEQGGQKGGGKGEQQGSKKKERCMT